MSQKTRSTIPVLCAFVLALLPRLAAPAFADQTYGRHHQIHTLDPRLAESLVWDICERLRESEGRCSVQQATPSQITVFGSDEVHAAVVRMLLEKDVRLPAALRFQVTLVRAAASNGGKAAKLPPNIARALDAVRELLPFKVFEVLDAGLMTTTRTASSNFSDDAGNPYSVDLRYRSALTRGNDVELSVEIAVRGRQSEQHPVGEPLLESVVTLDVGETVVAGTSRSHGGDGLLVLLTALPLEG